MASLVENDDDFCSVIPEVLSELELQSASFDDFFVGPEPNFSFPSPKAKIAKTGKEVVLYVKNAEESKDTKETKVPGTSAYATKEKVSHYINVIFSSFCFNLIMFPFSERKTTPESDAN